VIAWKEEANPRNNVGGPRYWKTPTKRGGGSRKSVKKVTTASSQEKKIKNARRGGGGWKKYGQSRKEKETIRARLIQGKTPR